MVYFEMHVGVEWFANGVEKVSSVVLLVDVVGLVIKVVNWRSCVEC